MERPRTNAPEQAPRCPSCHDRRVLIHLLGIAVRGGVARSAGSYGPRTTCYNRVVRSRQARVWDQILSALSAAHDTAVQMIDTSILRVHQHGACIADSNEQQIGRSRGGLTNTIHAVVDTNGLPVHLGLTSGDAHDNRLGSVLLSGLNPRTMLLADRGYDADWIRALARQRGAWANIPPRRNRKEPNCFNSYLYRARNVVERFFNKIKQCRRIATRNDKLAASYFAYQEWHEAGPQRRLESQRQGRPRDTGRIDGSQPGRAGSDGGPEPIGRIALREPSDDDRRGQKADQVSAGRAEYVGKPDPTRGRAGKDGGADGSLNEIKRDGRRAQVPAICRPEDQDREGCSVIGTGQNGICALAEAVNAIAPKTARTAGRQGALR